MAAAAAAAAANSLSSTGKSGRTVEYGVLGTSSSGDQRFPTPPPPLPEAVAADTMQHQQQQQQQQQQQMPPPQTPTAKIIADETVSNRRQSPDGKERDETRADGTATVEELGKNGGRCSVHEIPLRPSRDGPVAAGGVPMPKGTPVNENEALLPNASNISSWP
jgi:type IV secretory pathway VirB10-like protein